MAHLLFENLERIRARALYIGQRIDLRALETTHRLGSSPLVISAGAQGCAVLFRFGIVVLFDLNAVDEMNFIQGIKHLVIEPQENIETEEVEIIYNPEQQEGISQTRITLKNFSIERLQLLAIILAKSVVLDRYERSVTRTFDRIEPLATAMKREGKSGDHALELIRHIGDNLSTQVEMVGRAEITDKPDLLWEHPDLERLYHILEDEYELSERHLALERKLDLIARTAETLLALLQNKRSLRVEWYIVILIVFEIMLTLYQMLFNHTV
ncbi:MAG: hypothetical protein A2V90_01935 [Gammaproteobacteria bacterium RBG_16_57_12]|nr:MAG: hypothetical protein A2V90_01935 [Gammaproteobacteria bacterium RBG_16_57_12]